MPRFRYRAIAPNGEITEGAMEAPDRDAVIARLQADRNLPITADPEEARAADWRGRLRALLARPAFSAGRRRRQAAVLVRGLATLLDAGLTLDRALGVLHDSTTDRRLRLRLADMRERVRAGAPLSAALSAYPDDFGRFAVALVRAGEAGGTLAPALARLADYLERSRAVADAVRGALTYPAILFVVASLSIVILLTLVIPEFAALYRTQQAVLPLPTRIVTGIAGFLRDFGWLILLALLAGWAGFRAWFATPAGRHAFDTRVVRLPFIGDLLVKLETERLARSLAALLASGVAVPSALLLAAEAAGNRAVGGALAAAADQVRAGATLGDALDGVRLFPPLAIQLVRVGEAASALSPMLAKLADIYGQEIEQTTRRMVVLIEPLLILTLGAVIAGIMLSVMSAIVGLNDLAR